MNTTLLVVWAIAGWCGTVPISELIRELLRRRRPVPPSPDPWWLVLRFAGAIGGIAGGLIYNRALPMETVTGVSVAASAIGAVFGGILLVDALFAGLRLSGRLRDVAPQANAMLES